MKKRQGVWQIVAGVSAAIGAFILGNLGLYSSTDGSHHSVYQVHSVCASGIGQMAQFMSHRISYICSDANHWYWGLIIVTIIGVILAVAGVIRAVLSKQERG